MAKSLKKGAKEKISVTKVYEIIKSTRFINDLYWDLIADIKDKPSYKRMKEMINKLIEKQTEEINSVPRDDADRSKMKTMVAELSIVAYTVDTVLSEIMYKKLQNESHNLIKEIIEELEKEKAEKNNAASTSSSLSETNLLSSENVAMNGTSCVGNSLMQIEDSDSDSDVSIGKFSMASVSSVHTSELSSFDDTISISSEDEAGKTKKRKISLKEANEKYLQGKFSEIYKMGIKKKPRKIPKQSKISNAVHGLSTPPSGEDDSISRKTLPQRIRKPNSKYASENIVCPVKQIMMSQSDQALYDDMVNEKNDESPVSSSPRKRGRPRKVSDDSESKRHSGGSTNGDMHGEHNLQRKSKEIEPQQSPERNNSKHYEASDLYKPRPTLGRFGSRRSTAVTLFST